MVSIRGYFIRGYFISDDNLYKGEAAIAFVDKLNKIEFESI